MCRSGGREVLVNPWFPPQVNKCSLCGKCPLRIYLPPKRVFFADNFFLTNFYPSKDFLFEPPLFCSVLNRLCSSPLLLVLVDIPLTDIFLLTCQKQSLATAHVRKFVQINTLLRHCLSQYRQNEPVFRTGILADIV